MTSSDNLSKIDELYEAERHQEVYDMLRRPDGNYDDVPAEILWRFTRAIRYLRQRRQTFKEEVKAYEINSQYFVLLHCLGAWCFEVAKLNRFERELAAIFFTKPPESSFEEALRYYLESYRVNPKLIFTSARIAQCYDKLKNKEAAVKWAEKALSEPGRDDEAIEAQDDCRKIIKSYR
nr:hypothetical transcript [Hymenolepis microstoma]